MSLLLLETDVGLHNRLNKRCVFITKVTTSCTR